MSHVHTWWDNVSTQRWGTNHNHGRISSVIESNINVSQWMILRSKDCRVTQNCHQPSTCANPQLFVRHGDGPYVVTGV